MGEWCRLCVAFHGDRAVMWVDDQAPLVVERLVHPCHEGFVGIWSYLPANSRDLPVLACDDLDGQASVLQQATTSGPPRAM